MREVESAVACNSNPVCLQDLCFFCSLICSMSELKLGRPWHYSDKTSFDFSRTVIWLQVGMFMTKVTETWCRQWFLFGCYLFIYLLEVTKCKGVMLGALTANLWFLMTHLHELINRLMWGPFLEGWLNRLLHQRCVCTKEQCLQVSEVLAVAGTFFVLFCFLNFLRTTCTYKITVRLLLHWWLHIADCWSVM